MFFPIRSDRPARRTPLVTHGLIIANMAVYLFGLVALAAGWTDERGITDWGSLKPQDFHAWQLVTSQFLHAPINMKASSGSNLWALAHLGFNMYFLWFFGRAVEDRLGRPGYLAFYLGGGVAAGLAHLLFDPHPVIGASGAVAGVTGGYAALFPRARVQVLVFLGLIFWFTISALWCVLIYIGVDVLFQLSSLMGHEDDTAHLAHLGGYAYGFAVCVGLLATGLLKHEDFDVFYLLRQWRRRAAFRAASRDSPSGLYDSATADTPKRLSKSQAAASAEKERLARERQRIGRLLEDRDLPAAAAAYRALLAEHPDSVMSEARQLDLANRIYADGDYHSAAIAYELVLKHYPRTHEVDQVRLILGLICTRHVPRPDRARDLLEQVRERTGDPKSRELADTLLAELAAGGQS